MKILNNTTVKNNKVYHAGDKQPVTAKIITTGFENEFRTQTKGDAGSGDYFTAIRSNTSLPLAPSYGSGLAFGVSDTHGYLYINYSTPAIVVGGGNQNKLNWTKHLAFTDSNVASATKLQNPRAINGTNFDGTGNITTSHWGTARTITIGNSGKSVNGAGNVSWSLSEIGAAPTNHSHDVITTKNVTDWNAAQTNGFWQGEAKANAPESAGWFWGYRMQHSGGYGAQIAIRNGGDKMYFRSQGSDGSGRWNNVYHSNNKPTWNDINGKPSSFYTHPNDANTRHVTDSEKGTWNGKANTSGSYASLTSGGVIVKDIRDTAPSPDSFATRSVTAFFNNHSSYGGDWKSGITIGGWNGGYQVWQLVGGSSTSDSELLSFRRGRSNTWGPLRRIYHEGAKPTPAEIGAIATGEVANSGANKVLRLDGQNDVNCRLVRTNYQDEGRMQGGVVFRVNNGGDNYLRTCTSTQAFRDWLNVSQKPIYTDYANYDNNKGLREGLINLGNGIGVMYNYVTVTTTGNPQGAVAARSADIHSSLMGAITSTLSSQATVTPEQTWGYIVGGYTNYDKKINLSGSDFATVANYTAKVLITTFVTINTKRVSGEEPMPTHYYVKVDERKTGSYIIQEEETSIRITAKAVDKLAEITRDKNVYLKHINSAKLRAVINVDVDNYSTYFTLKEPYNLSAKENIVIEKPMQELAREIETEKIKNEKLLQRIVALEKKITQLN